ncbi:MAG: transposase [Neisseriaceae bacterium]
MPKNIKLFYLLDYSPELNQIEKLWEYITNHTIKNKIYKSIDTLELVVSAFIAGMSDTSYGNLSMLLFAQLINGNGIR